jgi:cytochrome P450
MVELELISGSRVSNHVSTETSNLSSVSRVAEQDLFDPLKPTNLQDPFAYFAKLRKEKPVYWNERYSFWMVTRYKDVRAALLAPRRFSSETGVEMEKRAEQLPRSARASFDIGKRFLYSHLQAMDPPSHTDQRQTVMNAFTPRVVAEMRAPIE